MSFPHVLQQNCYPCDAFSEAAFLFFNSWFRETILFQFHSNKKGLLQRFQQRPKTMNKHCWFKPIGFLWCRCDYRLSKQDPDPGLLTEWGDKATFYVKLHSPRCPVHSCHCEVLRRMWLLGVWSGVIDFCLGNDLACWRGACSYSINNHWKFYRPWGGQEYAVTVSCTMMVLPTICK